MVMDDGKEIIAKIPNPNAGRPHLTTASEVATMDYVYMIFFAFSIPNLSLSSKYSKNSDSKGVRLELLFCQSSWSRVYSHGTN